MRTTVNRIISLSFCLLIFCSIIAFERDEAYADSGEYGYCTICLSNIGNSGGNATSGPSLKDTKTIIGLIGNYGGYLIKLSDLQYLGCTYSTSGDNYYVYSNGQTIHFTRGSTYYTSTMSYSISVPNESISTYTPSLYGYADTYPVSYQGNAYVPLSAAVMQSGALFKVMDSSISKATVFHFCVNGSTPYSDTSSYLVGGAWLSNWTSYGTTNIAPHFKRNELWWYENSFGASPYAYQLKVATAMLQAEENTRYYHNNQSGMNVTSGYRPWIKNIVTSGSATRSMHMRGRAVDTSSGWSTSGLYNNVYNEFKGASSTPINYNSDRKSVV